jgi:iron complex outermembrane receptor protein
MLLDALVELAREEGVELLFNDTLVRNLTAKSVHGKLTVAQALGVLLEGTGIGYRATPDHAYVLFALPRNRGPDPGDGAIAEILVIGRRTQNADIRRTQNDIQPYKVAGEKELRFAQSENLDQFMRSRMPANTQTTPPALDVLRLPGATNSAVDLRGFGSGRTLVLVDGRRIPSLPSGSSDFEQGDLNGVPLGAVERVETLTSTAGGIYGPSAIGGVVNIVLRRDYRGADVTVHSGLSDRGDASHLRVEARLGFTPDHGDTDVMLYASFAKSQPLYAHQRDYKLRSVLRQYNNDPDAFLGRTPVTDAVSVFGITGTLRLDPALGGTVLASSHTFLPLDFTGTAEERLTALVANSRSVSLGARPGRASLTSNPTVGSALFNVRRRLSDRFEVFADGFYASNRGVAFAPSAYEGGATAADAPSNPFTQPVFFRFALPDAIQKGVTTYEVSRLTGGLIAVLPSDWHASADYAFGWAAYRLRGRGPIPASVQSEVQTGLPGPGGEPAIAPLDGTVALKSALGAYASRLDSVLTSDLENHFRAASLRAAGPVVGLPGGPLTLTLLAETRREHMPASEVGISLFNSAFRISTPERTQTVRSGYAEFRAPLLPADTALVLARGLELQAAIRHDSLKTRFPDDAVAGAPSNDRLEVVRHEATVFTFGARMLPAPWLMLRASVATGKLPPTLRQLQSNQSIIVDPFLPVPDPRRPGRTTTQDGTYVLLQGGSHRIQQEAGRTTSLGLVVNPSGGTGPRLSADYSRIDTHREIVDFPLGVAGLMAAEATYPDRVIRAPPTAADASLGLTVGRVIGLDLGMINAGRSVVEVVDFEVDWTLRPSAQDELRVYGAATWQPTFRRRSQESSVWIERVGYADGPLEWRGYAGLQWTRGPLTIDLNLQYFHSYRVAPAGVDALALAIADQRERYQGARRIPAQVYVDLAAWRRFEIKDGGPVKVIEARLGIQNVLDRSPPIVAEPEDLAYSPYGDPRRRRFELMLAAKF